MLPVASDSFQSPLSLALHPWILANPIQDAKKLERAALKKDILAKITFVAIAAICIAVLAAAFASGASAGTIPFVLLGLVFLTPLLSIAASRIQAKGQALRQLAEVESSVAKQFKLIKDWEEPQILEFLEKQKIAPPPQTPLRALLPLIARFEARRSAANIEKLVSDELLRAADISHSEIQFLTRRIGWITLEQTAVPAALDAALILQILSQPTLQLRISDLGMLNQKSFERRELDRQYSHEDNYFLFRTPGRTPLTLRELTDDLSPEALRAKLFPAAITGVA